MENNIDEKKFAPRIMMQRKVTEGKPLPVWIDTVIEYMQSEEIHEIVKNVREADARGDDTTKKKEKLKAAVVLPNACFMENDGSRKKENALAGGINCGDFDKIANPLAIYIEKIRGREEELGIVWVHRTISGKGLHIYFMREKNETLAEGQKRIADALGLSEYYDASCTDGGRVMIVSELEDTYYINKEAFAVENTEENKKVLEHLSEIDHQQETASGEKYTKTINIKKAENITKNNNNIKMEKTNTPVVYSTTETWAANYRGIEYKQLIDSYLRCLNEEGKIKVGDRNNTYFSLCCAMKYILPPNGLFSVLPDFGLDAAERWSCIKSAESYGMDQDKMPKSFRLLLESLSAEQEREDSDEVANEKNACVLRRPANALPEQLQILLKRLPDHFLEPVVFSVMPADGALATGLRFKYNGETHSFSFFSFCGGDPASGKGRVMDAVEAVIIPLRENDRALAEARRKYKKELKKIRETGIGEIPEEPEGAQRVVSTNISRGKLLGCIAAAEGEHIFQLTTEFQEYIDNARKDYGPQIQVYNHAFHNEYDGSDFMSEDAFSGMIKMYLNGSYTGTKNCFMWFNSNHHTGVDTRWLISELPKEFAAEQIEVDEYNDEELSQIADISRQLMEKKGYIYCPWIDSAAKAWREEKRQECLHTGSKAIDYFMNRDANLFVRMGYMLSVLYGCELGSAIDQPVNSEKEQSATAWARYLTDYLLAQQMKFFGTSIETREEINYRAPRHQEIYDALPEEFSTTELIDVCIKNNSSYAKNTNKLTGPWIKNGMCVRVVKGQYRIIKKE